MKHKLSSGLTVSDIMFRGRWRMTAAVMSVVVMVYTIYSLMLPALTLERQTVCGLPEHTHTDSCYSLDEESGEEFLVCGLDEHKHSERCYEENSSGSSEDSEVSEELPPKEAADGSASQKPDEKTEAESVQPEDEVIPEEAANPAKDAEEDEKSNADDSRSSIITKIIETGDSPVLSNAGYDDVSDFLSPYINTTEGMTYVYNGNGSYASSGWWVNLPFSGFNYNGSAVSQLYVNTNPCVWFGSSTSNYNQLSVFYYSYGYCKNLMSQSGTLDNGVEFLKIRFDGWSYSTYDSALMVYELFVLSTGDMYLEVPTVPTSYKGTRNLYSNGGTVDYSLLDSSSVYAHFVPTDSAGSNWRVIYGTTDEFNSEADGKCGDNVYYELRNGNLRIYGTGDIYSASSANLPKKNFNSVVIEDGVTNVPDSLFSGEPYLKTVSLPSTVKTIGSQAFYNCTNLESVTFADESELTSIGNQAFDGDVSLKTVSLPSSVKTIGSYAFRYCWNLESVTFADESELTTINQYAFYGASSLESFEVPANVTTINDYAFYDCKALKEVSFLSDEKLTSMGSYVFYNCTSLETISLPQSLTYIPYYAFRNCKSLKGFEINESVTWIRSGAFLGDESIESFDIPESVTTIDVDAFNGCSSMTEVKFQSDEKLTSMSSSVFANCTSLETISLPKSITTIPSSTFYNCSSLKNFTFNETVTRIGSSAFYGTGFETLEIPETITRIDDNAFRNCVSLTTVTFESEETLTTMGEGVFRDCTMLSTISLPASITAIPAYTFYNDSSLKTFEFKDTVTSIGAYAFYGTGLEGVTLPENITAIPDYAFYNCKDITSFTIGDRVTSIGSYAFYGTELASISIPQTVERIGSYAFSHCESLETAEFMGESALSSLGEYVFSDCPILNTFAIPKNDNIKTIPNGTFCNDKSITAFAINDNVTSIGSYAFSGSGLESIVIPATVTSVGSYAFQNCESMSSLTFEPESNLTTINSYAFQNSAIESLVIPKKLTTIYDYAFQNCKSLKSVTYEPGSVLNYIGSYSFQNDSALETVELPKSLVTIGYYAFQNCTGLKTLTFEEGSEVTNGTINEGAFQNCRSLENLVIPKNIKTIYRLAFYNCTSLKSVSYEPGSHLTHIYGRSGWSDYGAFYNASSLETVELPKSLVHIGYYAFNNCQKLKTLTFEEGSEVTNGEIREYAFYNCRSLENLVIPKNFKYIYGYAFYNCYSLKSVSYEPGSNLTHIYGDYTFYCDNNASSLETVELPRSLVYIGYTAFQYCQKLKSVTFEEGSNLQTIDYNAFYYDTSLERIEFPASLKTLNQYAFAYCSSLERIEFPASLKTLNQYAFAYCSSLKEAKFLSDNTLTSMGTYVFRDCTSLEKASVPESITTIPNYTFYNCRSLKDFELSDKVVTIGEYAFYNNDSLTSIEIPKSVVNINACAFQHCGSLSEVTIHEDGSLKTIYNYAFDLDPIANISRVPANVTVYDQAFGADRSRAPHVTVVITPDCENLTAKNYSSYQVERLYVAANVETVKGAFISSFLTATTDTSLFFEPNCRFTLDGDAAAKNFRSPYLEAGDYVSDSSGALYKIEGSNAYLVYCPPEIVNLTVPEKVDGKTVIGVKTDAFVAADDVVSVTFAKPRNITSLADFAFANAEKLEKINNKTTEQTVLATFATNVKKGEMMFYRTKITSQNEITNTNEDLIVTTESGAYLAVQSKMYGSAPWPYPEYDDDDQPNPNHDYAYYTGHLSKNTITISPRENEGYQGQGYKYSVFFKFSNHQGGFNYAVDTPQNIVSNEGYTYRIEIKSMDQSGFYRMDFPEIKTGDTIEFTVATGLTSPLSQDALEVIWAEIYTHDQERSTSDVIPSNRQILTWSTVPKTYGMSAGSYSYNDSGYNTSNTQFAPYNNDNNVTLQNSHFYSYTSITNNAYGSYNLAGDFVKSVDYTATLTLPNGLVWNSDVISAINSGNTKVQAADDNTENLYALVGGEWVLVANISEYGNYNDYGGYNGSGSYYPDVKKVEYDASKKALKITWNVKNPYLTSDYPYMTNFVNPGPDMIKVQNINSITQDTTYTIKSDWSQTIHYSYSEDQTQTSSYDASFLLRVGRLNLTKSQSWASAYYNGGSYLGNDTTFTITARRVGATAFRNLGYIEDSLPYQYYISADHIKKMLLDNDYGECLTITASNVYLEPYDAPTITAVDGNEYKLNYQNTAQPTDSPNTYPDKYNGMFTSTSAHPETVYYKITFTVSDGKVKAVMTDSEGSVKDTKYFTTGEEIQAWFSEIGYLVTSSNTFALSWHFPDDLILNSDPLVLTINCTAKNTFMRLNGDNHYRYNYPGNDREYYVYNNAYAYGKDEAKTRLTLYDFNGNSYSSASTYTYNLMYYDANLSTGIQNIQTGNDQLVVGSMCRVQTSFSYYYNKYGIMPVVNRFHGALAALVPVDQNKDRAWLKALEGTEDYPKEYTGSDGVKYYMLNKEGTYKGVYIGGYLADEVKVTDIGEFGLEYLVHWYMTDNHNTSYPHQYYRTGTINVMTLVSTEETGYVPFSEYSVFGIFSESWLNDHELHRLWDSTTPQFRRVSVEKRIVTDEHDEDQTPQADELKKFSYLHDSERVTYRLAIKSEDVEPQLKTLTGKTTDGSGNVLRNIYDLLPKSTESFQWTKGDKPGETANVVDIHYAYVDKDGNELDEITLDGETYPIFKNGDSWEIKDYGDKTTQYIEWNEDFECNIYDGTFYIYVTLIMPKDVDGDAAWTHFIEDHAGTQYKVYNTFYVVYRAKNMTSITYSDTVNHEFALKSEAMLNKGVVGSGRYYNYNSGRYRYTYFSSASESRQNYVNDDGYQRQVVYYVSLYNSGRSRVYVDNIVDILPKGFTYSHVDVYTYSNSTYDDNYYSSSYACNNGNYSSIAKITDSSRNSISYKYAHINSSTQMLSDGRQQVTFSITNSNSNINYDSDLNKCYLSPGEAFVFCYSVYTNKAENSEDTAVNNVAMKYYDYNDNGVNLSAPRTHKVVCNDNGNTGAKNDGVQELLTNAEAAERGFTGGKSDSQWLASSVSMKRGGIAPGTAKVVEKVTSVGDIQTDSKAYSYFADTIYWLSTFSNDGEYPITDYTITDMPDYPLRFKGSIGIEWTYSKLYNSNRGRTNLLTIQSWADNEESVTFRGISSNNYTVAVDGDWHLIRYNGPSSSTSDYRDYYVKFTKVYLNPNSSDEMQAAKYNLKVDFRFADRWWSIPEHGNIKLYCVTDAAPGTGRAYENKMHYNNVWLTPNQQDFDESLVKIGKATRYSGIEDDQKSVKNSAAIAITYGNATTSYLKITATDKPSVSLSSNESGNYIVLPKDSKTITYTMSVTSVEDSMKHLVMINNLPELGDNETFREDEERGSEFKVKFVNGASGPNIKVVITTENGNNVAIPDDLYTVDYSTKTGRVETDDPQQDGFTKDDWNGTSQWSEWSDDPEVNASYRSIRIIFNDPEGLSLRKKADVSVSFDAEIELDENGDLPPENTFAWDTFGYRVLATHSQMSQDATPMPMGVGVPTIPSLQKLLIDANGDEYAAEEDLTFDFIVYRGNQISSLNSLTPSSDLATVDTTLKNNSREYTYCSLTVPAGETKSAVVKLPEEQYTYSTAEEKFVPTENDIAWDNNASYTILELPIKYDDYDYGYIDGSTTVMRTKTVTYHNDFFQTFGISNRFKTWDLILQKIDEQEHAVADAYFGMYSSSEEEKISSEDLTDLLTNTFEGKLTRSVPMTVESNGRTFYLHDVVKTKSDGTYEWIMLEMNDYVLKELQSPSPYRINPDLYEVQCSAFQTITVKVENSKSKGYELPETGGSVLYVYILGGLVTITTFTVLCMKLRRRQET